MLSLICYSGEGATVYLQSAHHHYKQRQPVPQNIDMFVEYPVVAFSAEFSINLRGVAFSKRGKK